MAADGAPEAMEVDEGINDKDGIRIDAPGDLPSARGKAPAPEGKDSKAYELPWVSQRYFLSSTLQSVQQYP